MSSGKIGAGAPIGRLQKTTFASQIATRIRNAILEGALEPGSQLTEIMLAEELGVSRGPLREAIRLLTEEGLIVTVPYTGTYVMALSARDVREIYSFRTAIEIFAFEQIWDRRGKAFESELKARHDKLLAAIDNEDNLEGIASELALHSLVYEFTNHSLLEHSWRLLRGRLQIYWAAHHRAHGKRGPRRDGHVSYVEAALGDSLEDLREEIRTHMGNGMKTTERFLLVNGVQDNEEQKLSERQSDENDNLLKGNLL